MFVPPADLPAVMGVLNVTPDSFSDGGKYATLDAALARAEAMMSEGADIIDVGGESTRPGAEPVLLAEELRRAIPVVETLAERGIPVSIDTRKAEVARQAVRAGARMVNDVSALGDPEMLPYLATKEVSVCLMHMKGTPETMQLNPAYADVVKEVQAALLAAARRAEGAGVTRERIWLDPGFGFGKSVRHNMALLAHLPELVAMGYPILLGVSRKSTLGRLLGKAEPAPIEARQPAALAFQAVAQAAGVRMIRTHDVAETRRVVELLARRD